MANNQSAQITVVAAQQPLVSSVASAIQQGIKQGIGGAGLTFDDRAIRAAFGRINSDVRDFDSQLDRANKRVISLGSSFAVLAGVGRTLQGIVSSTREVEKAFTDINSTFNLSTKSLDSFSKQLFNVARDTSSAFGDAAEAAKEFSRQGLGVQETLKRTRDVLILNRLAAIDTADSINAVTGAINSFQKEALSSTQIVNKLATVNASFAVSSKDLATAITRVGASASDAGVSFDQLVGLVTTAKQITGRDGAAIAQALNTVFDRVGRTATLEKLDELGVKITDTKNRALPTIVILENLAKRYNELGNGPQKTGIADAVGGGRGLNALKGLLTDLSKANGVYAQTQLSLASATDEATVRNEALNQSLDATIERLRTVAKQVGSNLGTATFAGPVKNALNAFTDNPITDSFRDATKDAESTGGKIAYGLLKGLGNVLLFSGAPLITAVIGGLVRSTARTAFSAIAEEAGLNKTSNQEAAIQKQIVGLYAEGDEALRAQLNTMTSLTERAALLESILARRTAQSIAVSTESAAIASVISSRRPRAAEGFIPYAAEASAISAGVGGAPSGARPVYLPGFDRGGGQMGIVANTSEFMVPGAAGGAIFNRDMIKRYGLPPGSTPVAAGGFGFTGGFSGNLRQASGAPVSTEAITELNKLLENVQNAATRAGAAQLGKQVIDFGEGLNALSKDKVLTTLGKELEAFDKGLNVTAIKARIVDDATRRRPPGELERLNNSTVVTAEQQSAFRQDIARQNAISANNISVIRAQNTRPPLSANELSAINANEAISGFGKISLGRGSSVSALPQESSALSRLFEKLSNPSPTAVLGASVAASFLGGALPEGRSGTASGIALGGTSGALSGFGFGAGLGGLIGPEGALAGGGIGAVVGGFAEAISKLTKSSEELSVEIDNEKKVRGEQITGANEIIRLQRQIQEANGNGVSGARIRELREQQNQILSKQTNPEVIKLLKNNFNDPNLQEKVSAIQAPDSFRADIRSGIKESVRVANGTAFNLGKNVFGLNPFTDEDVGKSASGFTSALSNATPEQLNALEELNRKDPREARKQVGQKAGFSKEDLDQLTSNLDALSTADSIVNQPGQNPFTRLLTIPIAGYIKKALKESQEISQRGVQKAIDDVRERVGDGIGATPDKGDNQQANDKDIIGDVSRIQLLARLTQIKSTANQQIKQQQQQNDLSNPSVDEESKLLFTAQFSRDNIRSESAIRRAATIDEGRAKLTALTEGKNTTLGAQAAIQGADDLPKLQALLARLKEEGGTKDLGNVDTDAFRKALQSLIDSITELNVTERENVKVSDNGNDLQLQALLRTRTLEGGRDTDTKAITDTQIALRAAIDRREDSAVIGQARTEALLAQVRSDVRNGKKTEGQGDIDILSGSLSDQRIQRLRGNAATIGLARIGSPLVTGTQLESALLSNAQDKGQNGDSLGSLFDSFKARFAGLKKDVADFANVGAQVANSLESSFSNAFGNFVTGTKNAKDAFRDFALSVLNDSARAFATKGVQSLLGSVFGGGFASGGPASGVNALLTGGEILLTPDQVQRIGPSTARALNNGTLVKRAEGGVIRGGSGVRDDVAMRVPSDSYVIRKSMVQRYGSDYIMGLANGGVEQRAFGGGFGIYGALIGGILGAVFDKKNRGQGALLGAGLGYLGGSALQSFSSSTLSAVKFAGAVGSGAQLSISTGDDLATGAGSSIGNTIGKTLAGGAVLGGIASLLGGSSTPNKPLTSDQIMALRIKLESDQTSSIAAGRASGQVPILQTNPQGGQTLLGFGYVPPTRRYSGGGASASITATPSSLPYHFAAGGGPSSCAAFPTVASSTMSISRQFASGGGSSSYVPSVGAFSAGGPTSYSPATLSFSNGGAASMMATPMAMSTPVRATTGGPVNVQSTVTINDQRTTSQSNAQGGGLDAGFADRLNARVRQVTLQTIEEQQRVGGTLRMQSLRST